MEEKQFTDFVQGEMSKTDDMEESIKAIHGEALANKFQVIAAVSLFAHEYALLTSKLLQAVENKEVVLSAMPVVLMMTMRSKQIGPMVYAGMLTNEEQDILEPFLENASENLMRVVKQTVSEMRQQQD